MTLTLAALQELLGSRYALQRELGGGSMAAVYLAEDVRHGRPVAIKCLRSEYGATIGAERFLREIEIAAQLQHPHIVPLLDSGEAGGHLYLVMPYVEGESLRVRLVREGRLPIRDVIRILGDVADALAYAHSKGIVHRDIKPDNILLAGRHALVTDFGVAKAVSDATIAPRDLTVGVALGTPAYMAPEQATASPDVDHRADIYALGVVAYELLAGQPPFERPTAQAILTAHVLEAPVPVAERRPDIPPALAALVDRCLAKQRGDRIQSAEELGRYLEPLLTPSGGNTPLALAPVRRPGPRMVAILAVMLLMALVATLALILTRRPADVGMTGTQRQITFIGNVKGAAVSPDGQLLAYIVDSSTSDQLMVQDFRGGQAIRLSTGARLDYPLWSADGSEVRCYVFDTTGVWLRRVPRLGGTPRDLPVGTWASLSPLGDRIAIVEQTRGRLTIRQLSNGDSVTAPGEGGWWNGLPAWSPDGRRIVWPQTRQSGRLSRLMSASTTAPEPVTIWEDSLSLGVPAWSGDGKALFLMRARGRVVDLVRLPLDGRGLVTGVDVIRAGLTIGNPTTFLEFQPPPSLSQGGSRLVYIQRQEWSNVAVADLAPGAGPPSLRPLTTGSASYGAARLSPDERSVAVERAESEDLGLQILSLDSGPPRELGRMDALGGLAWSRKGDRLALAEIRPDGTRGLTVRPVNGGPAVLFAEGQVGDAPEWLTDSTVVVARLGNRSFQVFQVGAAEGTPLPGVDTTGWMFLPLLAPDRHTLAFAWNRGRAGQGVYVLEQGKPAREVFRGVMNPVGWSADSNTLYVADAGFYASDVRVIALDLRRGTSRLLGRFDRGLEVTDVTRDGRRAVVIRHDRRADAWTLEFPPSHQPQAAR